MTTFQQVIENASQRATEFKFKAAFQNVIAFPFVAIGWLFGVLFWALKWMAFLVVGGFQKGARMN
jgi:hypothetical protein